MRVAITGASGLIGQAFAAHLVAEGHVPVPFSRPTHWDPTAGFVDLERLQSTDAVVHLAGTGIADRRWTDGQKQSIRESRTIGTRLIADAMASLADGPRILVSGSAIGWYGNRGDDVLTETEPAGSDFLADVVVEWEAAAQPAIDAGIRVAFARTGIVLSPAGGALAKQLPFFRLGLGGRSGSGRQWQSWIDIEDEVRALLTLIEHDVSGPVNLAAPNPVTNGEFAKRLGSHLNRPTTVIPMIGPRLLYGVELADSLLLTSQRVAPTVLQATGFLFRYPVLDESFDHLLG